LEERNGEDEEGRSDNVFDQRKTKRQKLELQGEFQKIKPSLFEAESKEVAEAWLIDMNK